MTLALTIDGRRVEAGTDETLLEVLDRIGTRLPRLCHLTDLRPYGACRLCLVEQVWQGGSRMVTACDMVARAGGVFVTDSDAVRRMRRLVMELHLARCPDVPEIRAKAREIGVHTLRLRRLDDTCILCGLCERVCREVVGAFALTFEGRGGARRITSSFGEMPSECIGCGACSFVCPTGAIRMDRAALARLRTLPGSQRPCRHALTGLYPSALCSHSYECETCEVDQRLRECAGTHPALAMNRGVAARTLVTKLLAVQGKIS
jgi:predicted molibdopterin-dependent oxidoreductase YjgC